MIISKSKDHNENYLAKVIIVNNLRKHPNADALNMFRVDGNDIITSTSTPEGQVSIYFPAGSQLSHEWLSKNNDYREKLGLNEDPTSAGGFFEEKRLVKTIKLRQEYSEGYVVPISTMSVLIGDKYKELEQLVGESFDTIGDHLLLKKYIVPSKQSSQNPAGTKDRNHKLRKISKLIENQFRLHYNTAHLDVNLHKLRPESVISLTWKLHGTSFISGKPLCIRKLTWKEKLAKWLGAKVQETEYANIYSSRNVIKNTDLNPDAEHFYKEDPTVYGKINDIFKDNLLDGECIYGEAVGFMPSGAAIQKGYDYGAEQGKFKVYVYRITHTNSQGRVIDLPYPLVAERCLELGVPPVPLIYFGTADVDGNAPSMDIEEWRTFFMERLKATFLKDQDSIFCKNKVPEEGVVLRIEGLKPVALKMIAKAFKLRETKALEAGEKNIEDNPDETAE